VTAISHGSCRISSHIDGNAVWPRRNVTPISLVQINLYPCTLNAESVSCSDIRYHFRPLHTQENEEGHLIINALRTSNMFPDASSNVMTTFVQGMAESWWKTKHAPCLKQPCSLGFPLSRLALHLEVTNVVWKVVTLSHTVIQCHQHSNKYPPRRFSLHISGHAHSPPTITEYSLLPRRSGR